MGFSHRHPGEGRVVQGSAAAAVEIWIPAFAGMTRDGGEFGAAQMTALESQRAENPKSKRRVNPAFFG
jgi:hypothetical protein